MRFPLASGAPASSYAAAGAPRAWQGPAHRCSRG